jgi:membrane protein implicated in regulation of membrane protease activity
MFNQLNPSLISLIQVQTVMFEIYLACLIFGGLLLATSLIFGGEHGDAHASIEAHTEAPAESLLDHDFSHDSGLLHDTHGLGHVQVHHDSSQTAEAVKLVSIRNGIYFLSFFGLTGTLLDIAGAAAFVSFLSSVGIGALAAVTGYKFLSYLARTESGKVFDTRDFIGRNASVIVNLSKNRKGIICLEAGGQSYELVARAAENSDKDIFIKGDSVLIIDIDEDVAIVVESEA